MTVIVVPAPGLSVPEAELIVMRAVADADQVTFAP